MLYERVSEKVNGALGCAAILIVPVVGVGLLGLLVFVLSFFARLGWSWGNR